jgi:hypothetical protein
MNDQPPPELFAERPVRSDFARSTGARRAGPSYALRRIFTLAVIALVIGGILYWKLGNHAPSLPGEIPTIKAEGAYKQRPDQPGGIDIPNQDIQAYSALDNKPPPQNEVEHLLPPPEVPQSNNVPTSPPAAAPIENAPDASHVESLNPVTSAASSSMPSPPPATNLPTTANAAPKTKLLTTASQPTASQPAAQPVAPAKSQMTIDQVLNTASAPAKTGTMVQLASVPDQGKAQSIMQKLQAKYASLLGASSLRVVKADLGAKGIYYRVQSTPLTDDRAKSICAALKNDNAGCFIVRP